MANIKGTHQSLKLYAENSKDLATSLWHVFSSFFFMINLITGSRTLNQLLCLYSKRRKARDETGCAGSGQ